MKSRIVRRPRAAFIYTRVSTGRQATEGTSLVTQSRECRAFCAREGLEVIDEFEEPGASAKTTNRPEFMRLLAECRRARGKVGYLVVHSMSRFSRDVGDHHAIRAWLSACGIELLSATERFEPNANGRLGEGLAILLSQHDNETRSERTVRGMRERATSGRWVWKCPLGYLNGSNTGPSLLHDDDRGPLIRAAFEMFASGKHSKADVLRHVTALGLRAVSGRTLDSQAISKMLTRPVYAGRVVSESWQIDVRGDFQAIVSDDTFAKVQHLLAGQDAGAPRKHQLDSPAFPLRRFLQCSWCGTPITGSNSTGRAGRYGYYWCRSSKCAGDGERRVRIRKEQLEAKFLELLRSLTPAGGLGGLFREIVTDLWKERHSEEQSQRAKLTTRVKELAIEERKLTRAFVTKGSVDERAYKDLRDALREEATAAGIELQRIQSDDLELDRALDLGERLLEDAAKLWLEIDPGQRSRLQRFVYPDGLTFDGERFGTAVTCGIFSPFEGLDDRCGRMVTPRGFEPLSPG